MDWQPFKLRLFYFLYGGKCGYAAQLGALVITHRYPYPRWYFSDEAFYQWKGIC
jgi:hypothetical protein